MLIFWRLVSFFVLLAAAVLLGTLWAKLLGTVLAGAGLFIIVLAPAPVLVALFVLAYWIDGRLARMAKRKARERPVDGW